MYVSAEPPGNPVQSLSDDEGARFQPGSRLDQHAPRIRVLVPFRLAPDTRRGALSHFISGSVHELLLALCSAVTPCGTQGTWWGVKDSKQAGLHYCSGPSDFRGACAGTPRGQSQLCTQELLPAVLRGPSRVPSKGESTLPGSGQVTCIGSRVFAVFRSVGGGQLLSPHGTYSLDLEAGGPRAWTHSATSRAASREQPQCTEMPPLPWP